MYALKTAANAQEVRAGCAVTAELLVRGKTGRAKVVIADNAVSGIGLVKQIGYTTEKLKGFADAMAAIDIHDGVAGNFAVGV